MTKSQFHTCMWHILVILPAPFYIPPALSTHLPSLQVPFRHVCLSVLFCAPLSLTRAIYLDTSSLEPGGLTHGHITKGNYCLPLESPSSRKGQGPMSSSLIWDCWQAQSCEGPVVATAAAVRSWLQWLWHAQNVKAHSSSYILSATSSTMFPAC